MGSDLFAIKLHKPSSYGVESDYNKNADFDKCMYLVKYTDIYSAKIKEIKENVDRKMVTAFAEHPKFIEYLRHNELDNYSGEDIIWDVLEKDDYIKLFNHTRKELIELYTNPGFEAVLNKNII